MRKRTFVPFVLMAAFAHAPSAWAVEKIGVASAVANTVEGAVDGQTRHIKLRDAVFYNERVSTGTDGTSEFVFLDETSLQLGPDSSLTLDAFVYDPSAQGDAQKMAMTLGAGVFRFVSGNMDKAAYDLNGLFGHIGVRGTSLFISAQSSGEAFILVENGVLLVFDKNGGGHHPFPAGSVVHFASSGGVELVSGLPPNERHKYIKFNLALLGAGGSLSHRLDGLAAKASFSLDVYEEGCH